MGFSAKSIVVHNDKKEQEPARAPLSLLDLNKPEVEVLLNLIKESHFKGADVQKIFELVLKLQNYYTKLP